MVGSVLHHGGGRAALVVAACAAAVLATALYAEWGLGLRPCALCHWQRIPWIAALAFGLLALPARPARPAFLFGALLAVAVTGALGLYHLGVEQGAWRSFLSACSAEGTLSRSVDDLFQALGQPAPARCDVAAPWWFGWSMALWNALAAAAVLLAAWAAARFPGLGTIPSRTTSVA